MKNMLICSMAPFLMLRLFLSNVRILYITGKLVRCQSVENLRHGIAYCMLGIFLKKLPAADYVQNDHFQKIPSGTPSVSNSLDLDQARHFVGPDLAPNCLQRLSADDTGVISRRHWQVKE